MTTRELLVEFADIMNDSGEDSPEVRTFISSHCYDNEFVELAEVSVLLKKSLRFKPPSEDEPASN